MAIFFTSDTHYGHANVIRYSGRPFASAEQMDEAMIRLWNERVGPDDDVYHLGDFSLGHPRRIASILDRLGGRKHLIFGNHDKSIRKQADLQRRFVWCKELHEMYVPDPDAGERDKGRQKIVLCHYALRVWNKSHYGSWNLHGHSHGTLVQEPHLRQMDVGVDAVGPRGATPFAPATYDDVKRYMRTRSWKPIDHHGTRELDE